MAKGTVEIELAGRRRVIPLRRNAISVGRSPDCELVLPFPWLRERHVDLAHDAGLVRIRLGQPGACASAAGHPIGTAWEMLPEGAAVEIAAPQGATLSLRFKFESSIRGGSLLASERNQPHAARDDVALALPVEIVEQSPLESAKGLFRDTPVPARSRAGPHVRRSARSPKRIAVTIAVAALASILLMLGALGWNISRSSGHSRQLSEAYSSLRTSIDTARELIRKGNYVEAKATLDSARELARQWPGRLDDFATEIENVAARPEIRLGATGHVLMEGQWLPAETARAWRVARERDDPTIASLRSKAEATLKSGDWESGRAACDEALAMIDAHPLKPHPQADNLSKTRELLNNRIVTKEMTAKGFVLHEEKGPLNESSDSPFAHALRPFTTIVMSVSR